MRLFCLFYEEPLRRMSKITMGKKRIAQKKEPKSGSRIFHCKRMSARNNPKMADEQNNRDGKNRRSQKISQNFDREYLSWNLCIAMI